MLAALQAVLDKAISVGVPSTVTAELALTLCEIQLRCWRDVKHTAAHDQVAVSAPASPVVSPSKKRAPAKSPARSTRARRAKAAKDEPEVDADQDTEAKSLGKT